MSFGIWNNIDELALYLGLGRLDGETNDELAARVKRFPKWRYKTDYYTQVHSIPIQLGLNTDIVARIKSVNGNKYECNIDWDYLTLKEILPNGSTGEFIRIFLEAKFDTLKSVVDKINSSTAFICTVYDDKYLDAKLTFLVRNNNIKIETIEIEGKYSSLVKKDIVKGSVRIDDPSYRRIVTSISDLKRPGDFYVDYETGFIQTHNSEPNPVKVTFRNYDPTFGFEITELNLVPVNRVFAYGITDDSINTIPYLLNNIVAGE